MTMMIMKVVTHICDVVTKVQLQCTLVCVGKERVYYRLRESSVAYNRTRKLQISFKLHVKNDIPVFQH